MAWHDIYNISSSHPEDSDRPIAQGQDDEQETNCDEDTASDSSIPYILKTQPPFDPASSCAAPSQKKFLNKIQWQPLILPSHQLLLWKKTEISPSPRSETCWIQRHRLWFLQCNWKLPTGSIHMYSTHQRLLQKNCKIWSHISYYYRLVSYLPQEMLQIYPSPNRWYSRSLNNKDFPFSLWVGDGSKYPYLFRTILLSTTPSKCKYISKLGPSYRPLHNGL